MMFRTPVAGPASQSQTRSIEEDLIMRGFDLTPYRRTTVGFDRLFDLIENSARLQQPENYPPYNIERLDEDRYRVTIAVAGFKAEEIDITAQQNLLQVSGRKAEVAESERANYLHIGIANRSFERRFELADFVRVERADLADGLLTVELVREVPDAMKPRKIAINGRGAVVDLATGDKSAA
jgi:molecular chaperone IbpA